MHVVRPKFTSLALWCLYANWAIGILSAIGNIFMNPEHLAQSGMSTGSTLLFAAVLFAILFFIYYSIGQGKNWARILFVVLFVLGLLGFILSYHLVAAQGTLAITSSLLSYLLQLAALLLLYTKESSLYFKMSSVKACCDRQKYSEHTSACSAANKSKEAEKVEPSEKTEDPDKQ